MRKKLRYNKIDLHNIDVKLIDAKIKNIQDFKESYVVSKYASY